MLTIQWKILLLASKIFEPIVGVEICGSVRTGSEHYIYSGSARAPNIICTYIYHLKSGYRTATMDFEMLEEVALDESMCCNQIHALKPYVPRQWKFEDGEKIAAKMKAHEAIGCPLLSNQSDSFRIHYNRMIGALIQDEIDDSYQKTPRQKLCVWKI
jgi:hypothetical protein